MKITSGGKFSGSCWRGANRFGQYECLRSTNMSGKILASACKGYNQWAFTASQVQNAVSKKAPFHLFVFKHASIEGTTPNQRRPVWLYHDVYCVGLMQGDSFIEPCSNFTLTKCLLCAWRAWRDMLRTKNLLPPFPLNDRPNYLQITLCNRRFTRRRGVPECKEHRGTYPPPVI